MARSLAGCALGVMFIGLPCLPRYGSVGSGSVWRGHCAVFAYRLARLRCPAAQLRCRGSWTARLLAFARGVVARRGAGLGLLRRGQRCVIEVAPAPGFAGLDGPDDGVTAAVMMDARVSV